jgi:hypothetical protein
MQPSYFKPNEAPAQDNAALSKVIERNIRTIIHLCTKDAQRRSPQSRIADAIPSLFMLISQNRLSEETEQPADLDLHIGLLTEHELTHMLQMVDPVQDRFGIMDHANSERTNFEMETRLEDIRIEIHRYKRLSRVKGKAL